MNMRPVNSHHGPNIESVIFLSRTSTRTSGRSMTKLRKRTKRRKILELLKPKMLQARMLQARMLQARMLQPKMIQPKLPREALLNEAHAEGDSGRASD